MKRKRKFSVELLLIQLSDMPILLDAWLLLGAVFLVAGWYWLKHGDFEEHGIFWLRTIEYGCSGILIAIIGGVMVVVFWINDEDRHDRGLPTHRLRDVVKATLIIFFCIPLICLYGLIVFASEKPIETAHLNDHRYYLTYWEPWDDTLPSISLYRCNEIGFECDLICSGGVTSDRDAHFDQDRLDLIVNKTRNEIWVEFDGQRLSWCKDSE